MVLIQQDLSIDAAASDAADWIEFKAISLLNLEVSFSSLIRMLDINDETGGSYREDAGPLEEVVNHWVAELGRRKDHLGDCYPFSVSETGVSYLGTGDAVEGRYCYLLCLVLSHAKNTDAISGRDLFGISNNDVGRAHFQQVSTYAAAGYISGISVSFGWPRKDGTNFLAAIKAICDRMQDGAKATGKHPPGGPDRTKDFELDIISWVPTNDNLPGKAIVAGQVASGDNWLNKPLRSSIIRDLDGWVHPHFASRGNVITALFIPFSVNEKDVSDEDKLHFLVGNQLDNVIFYRNRIPFYVDKVFRGGLMQRGDAEVYLVDDITSMYNWVDEKLAPLSAG